MRPDLAEAAARLRRAEKVVVLTGAGVSAESGVPTFRGEHGLWRNFRPEELANPEAFSRDPQLVWDWYLWRMSVVAGCEPNPGHDALVELERRARHFRLITQNIDGLHRRAGSQEVIELHGNLFQARCTREGEVRDFAPGDSLKCACGAWLRPHIVWFGESLDPVVIERALLASRGCGALLSVGTSALVSPANRLPRLAQDFGACVIEVNTEPTPLTAAADYFLKGPSGEVLPRLLAAAFPA